MTPNIQHHAGSVRLPENRIVILGAGKCQRHILPSAMVRTGKSLRVIDWQLSAFRNLKRKRICYVGGYQADVVESQYPDITYFFNPQWDVTGPLASLSLVSLGSRTATYICYADMVFRPSAVEAMENHGGDVVVTVDRMWRNRYASPHRKDMETKEKVSITGNHIRDAGDGLPLDAADAQFTGLIRVSGRLGAMIESWLREHELPNDAKLSYLVRMLLLRGVEVGWIDMHGDWAELDAPQDLARFVLGTKAESLERLRPLLHKGIIMPQVAFSYKEWCDAEQTILSKIADFFPGKRVIVRSSAITEDSWRETCAGIFRSIPNVSTFDNMQLRSAISEVFSSFHDRISENQVLIQRQLDGVVLSGVVMTRTPSTGAPYYVINYDDTTSRTDTVTSGSGQALKTIRLHRDAVLPYSCNKDLNEVLKVVREVEHLVGHDALDIEFAVNLKGQVFVLQVRPIAAAFREQIDDSVVAQSIAAAKRLFLQRVRQNPLLLGHETFFSVMADWNPAEMIGLKPSSLAFSLYRYLITDEGWAKQRSEYGYRDVRPMNLIVDFMGHPYVDMRVDFNSFVPASLPDELAEKLVNYYLNKLRCVPDCHDKVEFDVVLTCWTLDFDQKAAYLIEKGFTPGDIEQIRRALLTITHDGIRSCRGHVQAIETLPKRYETIMESQCSVLEKAYLLLEDVRLRGVIAFAHMARNAFVAMGIMRSLKATAIITDSLYEEYLASMRSIATMINQDAHRVARNLLSWEEFVGKYGHLRPGSYDITSPCYANKAEEFLRPIVENSKDYAVANKHYIWPDDVRKNIEGRLRSEDMTISFDELDDFMRMAIEWREMGKFVFMRNINAALELLAGWGASYGISREEISCLNIRDIIELSSLSVDDIGMKLKRLIRQGKEHDVLVKAIDLPDMIFSESDFVYMQQASARPNYVTLKKVCGSTVALLKNHVGKLDLSGKIVVVPHADPGYDWLFTRNIKGLVTRYGGANSHMAVRAAEYQLPSAIGVGEQLFEQILKAEMIELNCQAHNIRIIR